MRRALVVYESLFGDAAVIARAVAAGLAQHLAVEAVRAAQAPAVLEEDVALLVVGAPNHQFGMPRPASRVQATRDFGVLVDEGVGLREWLATVTAPEGGVPAAAFDLRLDHPKFLQRVDHAARTAEKLLRALGCPPVAPAEHFFVTSPTGPLRAGEPQRAQRWGYDLAERVRALPGQGRSR